MRPLTLLIMAALVVLNGCAGGAANATSSIPGSPTPSSTSPTASTTPDPLANPSLSGSFAVDSAGRQLALTCWGEGAPTVFLESGGGAVDEFTGTPLVRRLAEQQQVCLYNRAGREPSDPAPNQPREAEDVAADFHALIRAAGIELPLILFGRSFGGMLVTFYASEYPDDVAAIVVFDSPAPSATMTLEDFPEGVWDDPGNVEHLNVLRGFENRFGKEPVQFVAPLVLISPTAGESTPEDQYWLQTSPGATQVMLDGGMEVIDSQARRIAEEIAALAER
jgi:pimeloyl-ACP methyl ester carboxylesterase